MGCVSLLALTLRRCAPAPRRRWREQFPTETFVGVDGVDICYERIGHGPPVLLVHGVSDSMDSFRFLAPMLAERYTVYRLDVKGAGHSERPWPANYGVRGIAAFLTRFLDAVGVERAAVVGSSWGGVFALRMALFHPERVSAVVPIGTMAYREPVNFGLSLKMMRWPVFRTLAPALITRALAKAFFDEYMFSPGYAHASERFERFWENLQRENGKRVFVAYVNGWDEAEFAETEHRYASLSLPTLVLWGEEDAFFPPEQALRLSSAVPEARLDILPGGSHSIIEERPEKVAAEILLFLDGLRPW
jgi:pimeloyl-ACP methyl ester carboxylesterase